MLEQTENRREDFIKAAFDLTRESGIEELSVENLEEKLHAKPSSFFSFFDTIDEIRKEVLCAAREYFYAKKRRRQLQGFYQK